MPNLDVKVKSTDEGFFVFLLSLLRGSITGFRLVSLSEINMFLRFSSSRKMFIEILYEWGVIVYCNHDSKTIIKFKCAISLTWHQPGSREFTYYKWAVEKLRHKKVMGSQISSGPSLRVLVQCSATELMSKFGNLKNLKFSF